MSILGKIATLFEDDKKTKPLFPRTKTSAVSDADGVGLDAILDGCAYTGDLDPKASTAPIDANSVGGYTADKLMLKENYGGSDDYTVRDSDKLGEKEPSFYEKIHMDLLWENPAPNSPMGVQSTSLSASVSDYSLLLIESKVNSQYEDVVFISLFNTTVGQSRRIFASHNVNMVREFSLDSETVVTFKEGFYWGKYPGTSNDRVVENLFCVPIKIYGIK